MIFYTLSQKHYSRLQLINCFFKKAITKKKLSKTLKFIEFFFNNYILYFTNSMYQLIINFKKINRNNYNAYRYNYKPIHILISKLTLKSN